MQMTRRYSFRLTQRLLKNLDALTVSYSIMHQQYYQLDDIKQCKLMLNSGKTELLVLNACHRPCPPLESITVGRNLMHASRAAKNIGIWFDEFPSMDKQVKAVYKSNLPSAKYH